MTDGVQVGIVSDSEVIENRDSEDTSLMMVCELSQVDDNQNVERYGQAGEDYNPPPGSTVIVLAAGKSWKIAIACEDGIESETEQGERRLYASDDGAIKSSIWFKKNGILQLQEIIGTGDFAVRFNELETAFNQLKKDFNDHINDYDNHVHNGVTVGTGSTGVPTVSGTPSTADITPAKVSEITVPEYVP